MGCLKSKPVIFPVMMADESGKFQISGHLYFKGVETQGVEGAEEPEVILLNHWKQDTNPDARRYTWKISQIKSYGYCRDVFMFDSGAGGRLTFALKGGSKTPTLQEQRFLFKSSKAKQIFKILQHICKKQAMLCDKNFESNLCSRFPKPDVVDEVVADDNSIEVFGSPIEKPTMLMSRKRSSGGPRNSGNVFPLGLSNGNSPHQRRSRINWPQEVIHEEPTHFDVSYPNDENEFPRTSKRLSGFYDRIGNPMSRPFCVEESDPNNNVETLDFVDSSTMRKPSCGGYSMIKSKRSSYPSLIEQTTICYYNNLDGIAPKKSIDSPGSLDVDYYNIDTPTPSTVCGAKNPDETGYSSGISNGSGNEPVEKTCFPFPPQNEDPNDSALISSRRGRESKNSDTIQVEVHEPLPSGRRESVRVVYTELDNSDGRQRKRTNSINSTNEFKDPWTKSWMNGRRSRQLEDVKYCQLDVDRTAALAAIADSRRETNIWRHRRATTQSQNLSMESSFLSPARALNLSDGGRKSKARLDWVSKGNRRSRSSCTLGKRTAVNENSSAGSWELKSGSLSRKSLVKVHVNSRGNSKVVKA